jgi:N-acetylglucosamine kinase-like BadF-type ATPase
VTQASQLVTAVYSPEFNRARIASLAPEILAACRDAPDVGARLLTPAGTALAEMVVAVAQALGWPSGSLPLATAGSFLLSAAPVQQAMIQSLLEQGYQPAVTVVPDPARGAVILAERALSDAG